MKYLTGLKRWIRRLLTWTFVAVILFVLTIVVGLIPVNNDFEQAENGIEIFVACNSVHSDIIVPKVTPVCDWTSRFRKSDFGDHFDEASHVAFGWGDRSFYLETETWEDFRLNVAANALFLPSGCCMHVEFVSPDNYSNISSVTITEEQYRSLLKFLESSFKKNPDDEFQKISGFAYSTNDAFYEATGSYHLLNTCNSWIGRALQSAGVRTPMISPLPNSPTLYFTN